MGSAGTENSHIALGDLHNDSDETFKPDRDHMWGHDLNSTSKRQVQSNSNFNLVISEHVSTLPYANKMMKGVEIPMQSNNFDGIKAHINSTFEGTKEVDVQLSEGVLDLRKHSVVVFKEHPNSTEHTTG